MNAGGTSEMGWENAGGGELTQEKRYLSLGTATVMMRSDGKSWMWWVDVPGVRSEAAGTEPTRARARYRAMLVYLALTREGVT